MTKCILVYSELEKTLKLKTIFETKSIFFIKVLIIKPAEANISIEQQTLIKDNNNDNFLLEELSNIRLLNPKLDRKLRQINMRKWLIPFGFIAGLSFSNMTNLSTFSFLGLNNFWESIFGGLLGMISGYLGSIFGAGSINLNRNKEIRSIINFHKNGQWLLLLENEIGYEIPWNLIKESEPKEIIFVEN